MVPPDRAHPEITRAQTKKKKNACNVGGLVDWWITCVGMARIFLILITSVVFKYAEGAVFSILAPLCSRSPV